MYYTTNATVFAEEKFEELFSAKVTVTNFQQNVSLLYFMHTGKFNKSLYIDFVKLIML